VLKKIPGSYVLLFYIIVVLGIASYFIPAGTYDREIDTDKGISYVVPDSYKSVENTPVSIFDIFKSIPEGMMEASDIIIFVLIIGGAFGVIQSTGTTDALIGNLVRKSLGNEKTIVAIIMTLFSLSGALFGTAEEALPFYPLIICFSLAMGYDKITGVAMVLLGTGTGFAAGFLNPFTTGIAQNVSELPLYSGIVLRVITNVIFLGTSIVFVIRHVNNIKTNRTPSIKSFEDFQSMKPEHYRVMAVLVLSFIFMIAGILKFSFYILEISTVFFIMAVASGLAGGLTPGRISSEFVKGASAMTYGALIIGIAKAVSVIMIYGNIMDSIIHALAELIEGFSPVASAVGMSFVHAVLNIFISSGSGQAAASMPIMKTLADISGITRQTAVLAFQFGDGLTNLISPTSGYFIAALALGDIEWKDWLKWFMPLFIALCAEALIILIISTVINYGPF